MWLDLGNGMFGLSVLLIGLFAGLRGERNAWQWFPNHQPPRI